MPTDPPPPAMGEPRIRVDIETIASAIGLIRWFDQLDLAVIDLHEHGRPIEMPPGSIDEFRLTDFAFSASVRW